MPNPTLALIMSTLRGDNRTGHKAVLWLRTRNVNLGCVPESLCGTAGGRARVLAEVSAVVQDHAAPAGDGRRPVSDEPEFACILPHPEPVEAFVGYLCRRHYGWVDRTLSEILELFAVLPEVLIPGPGGDGRSATRVGSPAPGRVEVMALTDPRGIHEWIGDPDAIPDVPGALGLWVRIMGEEREKLDLRNWDGSLVSTVRILRAERIWIAQQAWVDDYVGELEELHRHVARGAGTTLWPKPVGKCPNDSAPLYNTIGVDEITCRRCRFTWSGVALARLRLIFEQDGKRGKVKVEQEGQRA